MHTLTTWNPFRELNEISNRLLGVEFTEGRDRNGAVRSPWRPAVDIVEDDNRYQVVADLPKVSRDDVKVTVVDGVLQIIHLDGKALQVTQYVGEPQANELDVFFPGLP